MGKGVPSLPLAEGHHKSYCETHTSEMKECCAKSCVRRGPKEAAMMGCPPEAAAAARRGQAQVPPPVTAQIPTPPSLGKMEPTNSKETERARRLQIEWQEGQNLQKHLQMAKVSETVKKQKDKGKDKGKGKDEAKGKDKGKGEDKGKDKA